MTILEQRYLEAVPSRISDISKDLKNLNSTLERLIILVEELSHKEEEV